MTIPERRRDVRVRPSHDLPAHGALTGSGIVHESLSILDISVGGMALVLEPSLARLEPGEHVKVQLSLGTFGELSVEIQVRWKAKGTAGVQFVTPDPKVSMVLGKYVAELLERGQH